MHLVIPYFSSISAKKSDHSCAASLCPGRTYKSLYHTTPTNVKVEFTTCETACATEHASLTDMYSTTEKAPAERTCHSKDCHARALSLFRSRSCELKGVNPYPLRVCVCSLAAKPLWHTAHDGSHTFFPQGGLGGRIFGTALLVRCLLEASAENKNSKLCKTSCLQNCHENMRSVNQDMHENQAQNKLRKTAKTSCMHNGLQKSGNDTHAR